MREENVIEQINYHLPIARAAFLQKNEDEERRQLEIILGLFESLPYSVRLNTQDFLYSVFRNMGRFHFTSNKFQEAVKFIHKAQSLQEYKNELFDNAFSMKSLLMHSYVMLFLENPASQDNLNEAKKILCELKSTVPLLSDLGYLEELNRREEILNAVIANDIFTVISFEIPFPIIYSEQSISFLYKGTKCSLSLEIVKSLYNYFQSEGVGFFEIVEDKFGLANRTKVQISINNYLHPEEIVHLNTLSESNKISKALATGINVLNYFIEHFRVATNEYWIETINHKMLSKFNFYIRAGVHDIRNVIWTDDSIYRSHSSLPWKSEVTQSILNRSLQFESIPLWKSLLLDAKDYLLRNRSRESLISLNSAFENFIAIFAEQHLLKHLGKEEVDNFLKGIPNYSDFYLKDFVRLSDFENAIKQGLIFNHPPTTYQILKKCNSLASIGISNTKMQKLISKIRANRNEIVHGRSARENQDKITRDAIQSFEELVEILS